MLPWRWTFDWIPPALQHGRSRVQWIVLMRRWNSRLIVPRSLRTTRSMSNIVGLLLSCGASISGIPRTMFMLFRSFYLHAATTRRIQGKKNTFSTSTLFECNLKFSFGTSTLSIFNEKYFPTFAPVNPNEIW